MSARPRSDLRERIIQAAQESFHEMGYHGTGMDEILRRADSRKGSLYHHFASKEALADAVVSERLMGFVEGFWGRSHWHADPLTYLQDWVRKTQPRALARGCPVNTLAQETAFAQPSIREALDQVFGRWIALISRGLTAGVRNGSVQGDIDPSVVATYYLACFEGLLSLAKVNHGGPEFVERAAAPLIDYLEGLRPAA